VPDGTVFVPNAPFTKTWRMKNVGTCTWTTAYSLVFISGDRMGGSDSLFPTTVVPGQTVDLGVNLTAPSLAGSYRGYWQFKNASGALFGIGTNASSPFFVDIKVSGSGTGGTAGYDFVKNFCAAQWSNGTVILPCPGTDGDVRGFVFNVTNPVLENGVVDSRPGLLTAPQNISNGQITGTYPTQAVLAGDHFRATLDCQFTASDCFVIFRVDAQVVGGLAQNLGIFAEKYDGLYNVVDIDLSSLAGKNVNFVLTVLANGSATGDRAMWVGAGIFHTLAIGGSSLSVPVQTEVPATDTSIPTQTPTSTPTTVPPTNTSTPTPLPTNTSTPIPPNPSETLMPTNTP
jgi:hypothetical protein